MVFGQRGLRALWGLLVGIGPTVPRLGVLIVVVGLLGAGGGGGEVEGGWGSLE